jgi:hypothetical protein
VTLTIEGAFDAWIEAQPEREKDGYWHPSALYTCPRQALYQVRGVPESEPPRATASKRPLVVGTALHTLLQGAVSHAEGSFGILRVTHEVEILIPQMGVKGSADSLVEFGDGTSEVEEYKTKKMTGMWAALKKGTLPEDAHVNQGLTYAFALKYHGAEDIPPLGDRMRGVRVVYFSKGDEAIREYVRDLTPEWEDSFIDFMGRIFADVRTELAKRNVAFLLDLDPAEHVQITKADGKTIFSTALTGRYSFVDGGTGEVLTGGCVGYAHDSGDKATWKAWTGLLKYVLRTVFLLPTGDDPERDD